MIQSRINSYRLHSPFGIMEIHNPEPEREIVTVFRGGGPLRVPLGAAVSLDNFLLQQAAARGVKVVPQKVTSILWQPYPAVRVERETIEYDLVVLACGVNSSSVDCSAMDYSPPLTHLMAQDELYAGKENVQKVLGSGVQVFLFPKTGLIFGTLVPKGEFINISLLSKGTTPPRVEEFLATDLVRNVLSFPYQKACGCRPRIAVSRAKHFYANGFVAVGDAAVTRLYKDGIGSAFLTAREAARTAVFQGTSAEDFARYYLPYCHALSRNNFYGRVLFAVHNRAKDSPSFFAAHSRMAAAEWGLRGSEQPFNRIIWGMFTGSYDYGYIFRTSFTPKLLLRLLRATAKEKLRRVISR